MTTDGTSISEAWLKEVGFRWHQLDRQPDKHWLLWLGAAIDANTIGLEDLGVELAPAWWKNRNGDDVGEVGRWHCWLRSDTAARYHRFLHVRYLCTRAELEQLVAALTGTPWDPQNHFYGAAHTPKRAERIRKELAHRFDLELTLQRPPYLKWYEIEKDDSRGRALPEHYEAHEKARRGADQT